MAKTGQEQEFDYGIVNNAAQEITTPPYLTTTGMDGTQGKILSALIEKTDNKQNSLAVDGTGTKYPTVDAVNVGLLLKASDADVVHKTGNEIIAGNKVFLNPLTAIGVNIDNGGSNNGINIINNGSVTGINITSTDSGKSIVLNNASGANGIPFTVQNGSVNKLTINDLGEITGSKFIKNGANSTDALLAGGTTLENPETQINKSLSVLTDYLSDIKYPSVKSVYDWVTTEVVGAPLLGSIVPTDTPTGTGEAFWFATETGTYTNFGGVVVNTNSFAVISRDGAGAFSLSQTTLDISSKVNVADIIDNLNSTETEKPLSAAQGKLLDEKLKLKATLIVGKNKFDKTDPTIGLGYYLLDTNGLPVVYGNGFVTHYISIKAGQTLVCNNAHKDPYVAQVLYDSAKNILTYPTDTRMLTATVDGFARFSVIGNYVSTLDECQVELGSISTDYLQYQLIVNPDDIQTVNDSAISENIARISDVPTLVPNKNKFNYLDPTIILSAYFSSVVGSIETSLPNNLITHYIPIKAGQTYYSPLMWNGSGVYHELTDTDKLSAVYIPAIASRTITATIDGFARISMNTATYLDTVQIEEGTTATVFQPYKLGVDKELIPESIARVLGYTEITVKRNGTSGVDADFCGLNAIGDALESITDASENNRYKIIVDGYFLFKLQSDFVYSDPSFGEPTVIIGKNWVDIEGIGKDRTIVAVELTAGQAFTGGKTYTDFQPVMWNCNGKLSNMSIIAKNCRYTIHIESENLANNLTMNFVDLRLINKGAIEVGAGSRDVIGSGMRSGQTWNFTNCEINNELQGGAFAMHTALNAVQKGGNVNLTNCNINGALYLATYSVNRDVYVNLVNCTFNKNSSVNYVANYGASNLKADYSEIKLKSEESLLYLNVNIDKGKGLRIKSKTTGVGSTVKFIETSTAFNSIIGDSNNTIQSYTNWLNKTQYGYQWKSGGIGLSGYAIGGLDVDEANTARANSLGVMLGDCSVVNKTLTVIIDGVTYNVVFNENFTAQNNAYVIAKIVAVIGSVADVDTPIVGREYYPEYNNVTAMKNADTTAILKGMGVVFVSSTEMRRALNSDNRIDGVCLYDTIIGEQGKCLTAGKLYSMYTGVRFSTLETSATTIATAAELGVSATPGVFSTASTPKLLKCVEDDVLEIKR